MNEDAEAFDVHSYGNDGHRDDPSFVGIAERLDPARAAANRISEGIASAIDGGRSGAEIVALDGRIEN